MRRRTLLTALPTTLTLTGCSALSAPELRVNRGIGILEPAADRQISDGLQPGGDDRVFAIVTADESPELVTDETDEDIDGIIRQDGGDLIHLITQLRSTPDGPMELALTPGGDIQIDADTLIVPVIVESWGSFERIDDEQERERIRTAEELIYTGVWSLEPEPQSIPTDVSLRLSHRGR